MSPRTASLPPIVIRPFVAVVKPEVKIVEKSGGRRGFLGADGRDPCDGALGSRIVAISGVGEREVDVFRHGDYTVWG